MSDRIQDAYPLAPGQGGVLFQSLAAAGRGDYVVQIALDIRGAPDPERERESWRALVARHDALRAAFVWKGRKEPLQVIGRSAAPRIGAIDLSGLDAEAREARIAAWLAEDRAAGFDLSRAPLLRVTRFALGEARSRIVVTFHHVALDGWSIPILLRDWIALYAGRALPPAPPFRDHVAWLRAQDRDAALAFWREELAGPPPAGWALPGPEAPPATRRGDLSVSLGPEETAALAAALRRYGVTLATATQGVWAIAAARAAGSAEAVYGLARSGRPPAVAGAERRVGMHLNTLPMRARLDETRPLVEWLADLQARQAAQAPHEHAALAEIQAAIGRRQGRPLVESVVVFENYPTDPALLGAADGFEIAKVEVLEQTSLPLALFASLGDGLRLRLLYDAAAVAEPAAGLLLEDLRRALALVARRPDAPLSEVRVETRSAARPEREPRLAAPARAAPAHAAEAAALRRVWAELLETAPPEDSDNFFALGGHSLLAIALQDRIRREFEVEIEIADLFRFATLAAQAAHVARLRGGGEEPPADAFGARADARAAGGARLLRRRAQSMTRDRSEHV